MKLALVISTLHAGGAERVMSLLANQWAARGEEIALITLDSAANDSYPLDPRIHRIALDVMGESSGPLAALANNARRLRALRRALKESGADVVVSFGDN